jgi:hypothetical protein
VIPKRLPAWKPPSTVIEPPLTAARDTHRVDHHVDAAEQRSSCAAFLAVAAPI